YERCNGVVAVVHGAGDAGHVGRLEHGPVQPVGARRGAFVRGTADFLFDLHVIPATPVEVEVADVLQYRRPGARRCGGGDDVVGVDLEQVGGGHALAEAVVAERR